MCVIELLDHLTGPEVAQMAEWNAFYHNEEDEEEQEEGEQSGGEIKTAITPFEVQIIQHQNHNLVFTDKELVSVY